MPNRITSTSKICKVDETELCSAYPTVEIVTTTIQIALIQSYSPRYRKPQADTTKTMAKTMPPIRSRWKGVRTSAVRNKKLTVAKWGVEWNLRLYQLSP